MKKRTFIISLIIPLLVSWNVNGIRACLQKGFLDSFYQLDADIFCVQETKMQSGQADLEIEGYH